MTAGKDRQTFNCKNGEMPALSTAVTAGSRRPLGDLSVIE
jgi:hypothetical protein